MKLKDLESVRFTSDLNLINPTDQNVETAKASLEQLESIIPNKVDVNLSPDLLFIGGDLFQAGVINQRGEGMTIADSIYCASTFVNKFIDIEHKREDIVGNIISHGFFTLGENRKQLSLEEAHAQTKPFYVSVSGFIWKIVDERVTGLVLSSCDPSSDLYKQISFSWEVFMKNWDIAIGSDIISECEIITNPQHKDELKKYLKKFGGNNTKDGAPIGRIIRPPYLGVGAALTTAPAAKVKGIHTFFESVYTEDKENAVASENNKKEELEESNTIEFSFANEEDIKLIPEGEHKAKIYNNTIEVVGSIFKTKEVFNFPKIKPFYSKIIKNNEKIQILLGNFKKDCVFSNDALNKNMKIKNIQDLKNAFTDEALANEAESFAKGLQDVSEQYLNEKKKVEEALASEKEAVKTLNSKVEALEKELGVLRKEKEETVIANRFQERMAGLDEEFDFSDEERSAIVSEVRELDEEAFASFKKKLGVLAKEKSKAYKKEKEEAEAKKKKEEEAKASLEGVVASEGGAPNGNAPVEETTAQKFAKVFEENSK